MSNIEIKSSWDGDTTSYLLYVNGEHKSSHWNYEDAQKEAEKYRSPEETATVKFTVACNALYHSELKVPKDISNDEDRVLEYIRDHLGDCNVDDLEWLSDWEPWEAVTKDDIRSIE